MSRTRLDYDKTYETIMECRKSGLSDRDWCAEHNISPSTFYNWVRKLQKMACYEIPEQKKDLMVRASHHQQEVVCVNDILPKRENIPILESKVEQNKATSPFILQYKQAQLIIPSDFEEKSLRILLEVLKEQVC